MNLIKIVDGSVVTKSDLYKEIGKGLAIGAGTSLLWMGLLRVTHKIVSLKFEKEIMKYNEEVMKRNRAFLGME